MRVEIAKEAGFCYGVQRAVRLVREALEKGGEVCVLGHLIHNERVMSRLAQDGLRTVQSVEEVPPSALLVIRSHGEPEALYRRCRERGITILDATCPSVKRIHSLVSQYGEGGGGEQADPVIILGEREHPEVQGIAGWAKGPVYILRNAAEADGLPPIERALLVAQTTATQPAWEALHQALTARIPGLTAVKTICGATAKRQDAARDIAGRADAVLVVGDRRSANTQKLFDICAQRCPRTLLIGGGEDIPEGFFRARDTVGITAGASTPDWSLKEVVTRMNDMEKQEQGLDQAQQDFMADVEATLVKIRPGQTVTGTVVQITEDEVCVNIGYKSDGLISRADLTSTDCQIGDEIEVEVVKVNDGEGNVVLSQRNIVNRKAWEALLAMYENDEFVDGIGKDAVKGGLIADVMGVRAFIPASQLSLRYVERIEDFVGQELKLKIIEVDKVKKRIVASHKAYLVAEAAKRQKEIWSTLVEGEVVRGIVRRLTDFGAFVDIGGVDGLIHVTDLSWGRVRHPSDVVSPNQEIDVVLLSLDPERERIQLGYKQLQRRPWETAEERYPVGSIVEGKVVRITTFGAFVELEPGLDGLVHISQCALKRVPKVEDAVQAGAVVRVKVLAVDTAAKRISLSIREALEEEAFIYPAEIPGDEFAGEAAQAQEQPVEPDVSAEPVAEPVDEEAPAPADTSADTSIEIAEEIQPALEPVADAAEAVAEEAATEVPAEPVDAPAKPKRASRTAAAAKKTEEADGDAAEAAEPKKPRTRRKAAPAEEPEVADEPGKDAE